MWTAHSMRCFRIVQYNEKVAWAVYGSVCVLLIMKCLQCICDFIIIVNVILGKFKVKIITGISEDNIIWVCAFIVHTKTKFFDPRKSLKNAHNILLKKPSGFCFDFTKISVTTTSRSIHITRHNKSISNKL